MSVLRQIKNLLPISSRSTHAMYEDLSDKISCLSNQINDIDRGINGNIDFKFDELVLPLLKDLHTDLDAHDTHMKLFAWEAYRRENESLEVAKKRFFRSLPSATGSMRLLQLGCAQLLNEFDALCRRNNIEYWLSFGTLLGAARHSGFIPWDDDVDLGMMREDVERLSEILSQEAGRYRITEIFDRNVTCRQVRFWYADPSIPCFLDLFIYDWVPSTSCSIASSLQDLRQTMIKGISEDHSLGFWKEEPWYSADDEYAELIRSHFDRCMAECLSRHLICSKSEALGLVYSFDNMGDSQQDQWIYPLESVYPVKRIEFEGFELCVPNDYESILRGQYGDYLQLPKDINSHYQHVDHSSLNTGEVRESIKSVLDS